MNKHKVKFIELLRADGWTQDRFGHFHKDSLRCKMKSLVARIEFKKHLPATDWSPAHSMWVKQGGSLYYSDLPNYRTSTGQIKFGHILIGKPIAPQASALSKFLGDI